MEGGEAHPPRVGFLTALNSSPRIVRRLGVIHHERMGCFCACGDAAHGTAPLAMGDGANHTMLTGKERQVNQDHRPAGYKRRLKKGSNVRSASGSSSSRQFISIRITTIRNPRTPPLHRRILAALGGIIVFLKISRFLHELF